MHQPMRFFQKLDAATLSITASMPSGEPLISPCQRKSMSPCACTASKLMANELWLDSNSTFDSFAGIVFQFRSRTAM